MTDNNGFRRSSVLGARPPDARSADGGEAYLLAMERLADAHLAYERERQRLHQEYSRRVAPASAEMNAVADEVKTAAEKLRAARALAEQTDVDASLVWQEVLFCAPQRLASRAESLPAPLLPCSAGEGEEESQDRDATVVRSLAGPGASVAILLSEAYDMVDRVRRGRTPSTGDYAALVALGAAGAALGFGGADALELLGRTISGSIGLVLAVCGRIGTILSPLMGLAGVRWLLRRRASLFGLAVVPTVLASGIVTATAAALLLPFIE